MYGCESWTAKKAEWVPKNWCFWSVVVEKTLESPLDCKEIQPVHSKGDQSWVFFRRNDAEAETPILWPPGTKNWLLGKDPDAGKDWRQEVGDGCMASLTQWTWVWTNSGSWWRTGKRGILQFMGCKGSHNWVTELNWTWLIFLLISFFCKRNMSVPWGKKISCRPRTPKCYYKNPVESTVAPKVYNIG